MASITIPDIDDDLERRLMERAVEHGRSIEVEAREILEDALVRRGPAVAPTNLYDAIRAIVEPLAGSNWSHSRASQWRKIRNLSRIARHNLTESQDLPTVVAAQPREAWRRAGTHKHRLCDMDPGSRFARPG
jgi:plasmid stability protein